jgi:oxygen-independent coproporphyrinogen-3 oxidase
MSKIVIPRELLERFDVSAPRYTSYPPIPYWPAAAAGDWERWIGAPEPAGASLSLYLHIPFCRARCAYCACQVVVTHREDVAEEYVHTLSREMEYTRSRLPGASPVRQFHLGGGTPTYLSPSSIAALVTRSRELFAFDPDPEMSIEVDPRTVTGQGLGWLRDLRFNRISLGIQDFDPGVQEAVNRDQPFEMVERVMAEARSEGFHSVNFDLIYGLPRQTPLTFARTLDRVLALLPDRLALYNYAHLPEVFAHQRRIDPAALPHRDQKLEIFLSARERLTDAGYEAIGLDHFARPGDELAQALRNGTLQRNFMGYTTRAGSGLLGFGLSAISDYRGAFWQNEKKLSRYTRAVLSGAPPVSRGLSLSPDDRIRKAAIGGLFCGGFVNLDQLGTEFQIDATAYFQQELEALQPMEALGLVSRAEGGYRVTEVGQFFLRNIALNFDAYHGRSPQAAPRFSRAT